MPNSNGEESEKTVSSPGESKAQAKRKRNRHRRKPKVENLVSKTFQAKLVAISSQSKNTSQHEEQIKTTEDKPVVQADSKSVNLEVPTNSDQLKSAPKNEIINQLENSIGKQDSPIQNNIDQHKTSPVMIPNSNEKTREQILAEREAKKLAKQMARKKNKENLTSSNETAPLENVSSNKTKGNELASSDKSRPEESKKETKNQEKNESAAKPSLKITPSLTEKVDNTAENSKIPEKKPALTKAERRAIQEAQRAAKANANIKKPTAETVKTQSIDKTATVQQKEAVSPRSEKQIIKPTKACKVKLFNHLESCRKDSNLFVNNTLIHPIIVRLGEQYAKRTIVGSNARCISFLNALKLVVQDYETPAKKEFARSLETSIKNCVDHLHKCRPLAVSVSNAYKHIKHVLTQLPVDQPESELKVHLCHFIDTYIENQIGKAAQGISDSVQDKISNGDVILTFGCSSLINFIFEEAHRREVHFSVIVVDSRPFSEGQELLRRLTAREIPCTYVLINAVGFVMPEVTKILLGAHALLSNGYVMARTGTAQVALVARSFNVPVLVCCETHKFSERFQTDAIVYNELGNPDDLILSDKCRLNNWEKQHKLTPLNLNFDITPPELVTAVVTEVAILPCTSVPVILRMKPTEIGY